MGQFVGRSKNENQQSNKRRRDPPSAGKKQVKALYRIAELFGTRGYFRAWGPSFQKIQSSRSPAMEK
jgi:hypothetical protein